MADIPVVELVGGHNVTEVQAWVESLRYFTFTGRYETERMTFAEELLLYLRLEGRQDLEDVLRALGLLVRGDGTPPSPLATPGVPRNIATSPDLVEPGACMIAGAACSVFVVSSALILTVAEPGGGVTAVLVEGARAIEAELDALGLAARVGRPDGDYVVTRAKLA